MLFLISSTWKHTIYLLKTACIFIAIALSEICSCDTRCNAELVFKFGVFLVLQESRSACDNLWPIHIYCTRHCRCFALCIATPTLVYLWHDTNASWRQARDRNIETLFCLLRTQIKYILVIRTIWMAFIITLNE